MALSLLEPNSQSGSGNPLPGYQAMALIKCKECTAAIAENAESCPHCGDSNSRAKKKNWFELFNTLLGPLILSAAGTVLAYITFIHQAETEATEQLQSMVESAVSNDVVKERTAVRLVSYLAKLNKLSPSFALSIFGSVARNGGDEKLRSEAYDAIENLLEESSFNLARFDKYDQLEIYCLQAALTPAQYWRQINLYKIEQYSGDKTLKYQAASKLLSLSQDVSDPQACIDLLLSEPIRLNNPDIIERAIPILCKAVKDRSVNISDKDVTDYLESLARQLPATNRDGLRCQIRLLLARSLVTRDPSVYENTLKQIAQICEVNPDFVDDTEVLLDAVARNMADTDLRNLVDTARNHLTLLKQKPGSQPTQKS
jgi:ribosomal protein L40E